MSGGNDDPSWLYGYDAWNVSLDTPAPTPGVTPMAAA
jgi:salicylate hydroxylase/6-hydroxynicotinate 3-monooxygenase